MKHTKSLEMTQLSRHTHTLAHVTSCRVAEVSKCPDFAFQFQKHSPSELVFPAIYVLDENSSTFKQTPLFYRACNIDSSTTVGAPAGRRSLHGRVQSTELP
jgi:hypothetical protein